ncbi:uncharacterized protein TNCT_620981 [Trichonephila clavata]|uniref:DDE-1 domain-containing protein n=1 Tax=Trichonephila clavata TaxID=2740835 RepID=A0A8X6KKS5_TRICU|nr:uncharacterized protein TNCT_620981 [Trichonephila clavata]
MHHESASADRETAEKYCLKFQEFIEIERYRPQQIFNCDETAICIIQKAWSEVKQRQLISAWKKLCPSFVQGDGGDQGDTLEIMDEILTTARDLELEVNEDDIEELIMEHEDELTTEELQEILNEERQETPQNVSPSEKEENERGPMPTSAIKDLLKKWEDVRAMVLEWHPNQSDVRSPERINRFHIEVYGESMIG